jgi:hypothetical protein
VGIVSTGLITQAGLAAEILRNQLYECVVVDEAHKARRRNLGPTHRNDQADANNLLTFLREVAPRTRSLLLGTATPVQLDPIEAFDLLEALSLGDESIGAHVLGNQYSRWRSIAERRTGLDYVASARIPPSDINETWEWMRNPLPPSAEGRAFRFLREDLRLSQTDAVASSGALPDSGPVRRRAVDAAETFFPKHNPYIRSIVRRTRDFLESTYDPTTNEPYLQPVRVRLFGEAASEAVPVNAYLADALQAAEDFCALLAQRMPAAGFVKTLLLRRVGSSVEAGRRTAQRLLTDSPADGQDEDDDPEDTPQPNRAATQPSALALSLTDAERGELTRFLGYLESTLDDDPKQRAVEQLLLSGTGNTKPWLAEGSIVFTQYYDSAWWLAEHLSFRLGGEPIALYAGAGRSGVFRSGLFERTEREAIKRQVGCRPGQIRLLIGTDAASEGLNLQKLGTLINLDLPWNPTRLEQRKGRIQRIGQPRAEVWVANLRYKGSVEDRVHQLLSSRLQAIRTLFGQLPDTLEDAWIAVALRNEEEARRIIDAVPERHPFELRYDRIDQVDWETCATVLDSHAQLAALTKPW